MEYGVRPRNLEHSATALAVAIQGGFLEVCKELVENGAADPNYCGRASRPPLLLAASSNHVEILRLLLGLERINVRQEDQSGINALMEACRTKSLDCAKALIADGRLDLNGTDAYGRNVLIYASVAGEPAILRSLLRKPDLKRDACDAKERNAISYAAEAGHIDVIRQLWYAQVSISAKDGTGRNAISWASNSTKANESVGNVPSVLEYLVRKSPASVDEPDKYGWTPLAWTLDRSGYLSAIKILVEVGNANLNQRDASGRSILAWAAGGGFSDITEYLLQRSDVEKNAADSEGRTALSHAAANGEFEAIKILLSSEDIRTEIPDEKGRTAKYWAALNHHNEIVQLLKN